MYNREEAFQQTKQQQRKTLNEISKNRCKNWPNTIEALRKKKEDDRIRKLEEEEIARRKQGRSINKFDKSYHH